jgi:hypothetical protein
MAPLTRRRLIGGGVLAGAGAACAAGQQPRRDNVGYEITPYFLTGSYTPGITYPEMALIDSFSCTQAYHLVGVYFSALYFFSLVGPTQDTFCFAVTIGQSPNTLRMDNSLQLIAAQIHNPPPNTPTLLTISRWHKFQRAPIAIASGSKLNLYASGFGAPNTRARANVSLHMTSDLL